MSLELFWKRVIEGKQARFLLPFLYFLSLLYKTAILLRHVLYDVSIFKTRDVKAKAYVISIGNIEVGGTGKTPVTSLVAEVLKASCKVAILSRGYKSEAARAKIPRRVSSIETAQTIGDEPCLFYKKLSDVDVWVGKNRLALAEAAIHRGARVLILDDGMQYRKIKKDYEIVVLNAMAPFCENKFLPRGRLRDFPSRLRAADLIILNSCFTEAIYLSALAEVRKWTDAEVIGIVPSLKINSFDQPVGVFCAIGNPNSFLELLKQKNIYVQHSLFKGDHESFSIEELKKFSKECQKKNIDRLLCTEKDGVKIPEKIKEELCIHEVPLELTIVYNKRAWEEMIEKIRIKTLK